MMGGMPHARLAAATTTVLLATACAGKKGERRPMEDFPSVTTGLHEKLDRLVAAMAAKGFCVDGAFNPGLTREQIDEKTRGLGFRLPEELYQLYMWHDGTRPGFDDSQPGCTLFLFRDQVFLTLDQAVKELEDVRLSYGVTDAFPFTEWEGSWLVMPSRPYELPADVDTPPTRYRLERPVILVFQGIDVFAYSLDTLIDIATEWVERGVHTPGDEHVSREEYAVRQDLELQIWDAHNPGIHVLPDDVFVAAEGFQKTVAATASRSAARVGEAIDLHAVRRTGPVRKAKRRELPLGTCWWSAPPPAVEDEVAGNLHWTVEPAGAHGFHDAFAMQRYRTITFSKPGTYQLRGRSATPPCSPEVVSNVIELRIDE